MTHVLIFARAPIPGRVKTRLAAELGNEMATDVYRTLGSIVVRQVTPVAAVTVWYDPPEAADAVRSWLGQDVAYRPQPTGDLGARLAYAFAGHFAEHAEEPALAIGTDAPGVDADLIMKASGALRDAEVVIGPAHDGGYYLIGLKHHRPELFERIPWGTAGVLAATQRACAEAGITPNILPVLRDVDRVDDLVTLGLWPS